MGGGLTPTGRNDGVGFGWGAYRNRFGGIEMQGTSIRSHSLSLENCAYLDSIAKGHKSAAVNSAITWYRGQGVDIHELLANIAALQEIITELHGDDEHPESPPRGGGVEGHSCPNVALLGIKEN